MSEEKPAPKNGGRIVMIGPDCSARGGIASVVASYRDEGVFDKWPIVFLPTHVEGGKLRKLAVAISAMLKFISLVLLTRVSVLHIHVARRTSFWRKAAFMSIALILRVPFLLHLHSGGFPDFYRKECGPVARRAIRFFLNRSACLIVLSSQWNALLKGMTTNTHARIIPNFVQALEAGQTRARAEWTILFLGRLNREKGLFDLLQAMSAIKDDFPLLRLEVGGEGSEKPVREAASRLNIESRIKLHGWVSGSVKDELVCGATIYVLPSYYEGLPMGVLEAMANGLPVIASDVGGLPDVIDSGRKRHIGETRRRRRLGVRAESPALSTGRKGTNRADGASHGNRPIQRRRGDAENRRAL